LATKNGVGVTFSPLESGLRAAFFGGAGGDSLTAGLPRVAPTPAARNPASIV